MKHLLEQPLYVSLKRYRIIAVVSIFFLGYMMVVAWAFFEANFKELTAESAAGFFTYVAALLGAFIKCVTNIQGKHED